MLSANLIAELSARLNRPVVLAGALRTPWGTLPVVRLEPVPGGERQPALPVEEPVVSPRRAA